MGEHKRNEDSQPINRHAPTDNGLLTRKKPARLYSCVLHLLLTLMTAFFCSSMVLYFDNSGTTARMLGLPAPTVPHNCIMSYTRPVYKPIQLCSPSNVLGKAVPTETCPVDPSRVSDGLSKSPEGSSKVSHEPNTVADDSPRSTPPPLGGDDPVNALGGSATAEGLIGFQLFSFTEGGYDVGRSVGDVHLSEPFRDVPVLLVPGNAGSYYDSRGMASAIALGNVRRSMAFARKVLSFKEGQGGEVSAKDVSDIFDKKDNASDPFSNISPLSYGNPTPSVLGLQPFAAGFLELAVVHNGHVLMRAAQHVRDSALYLRKSFLEAHSSRIGGDRTPLQNTHRLALLRNALTKITSDVCSLGHDHGHLSTPAVRRPDCQRFHRIIEKITRVEGSGETARGLDENSGHGARTVLTEQLGREVDRVRERGIWLIGHSLGGTAARLGAILALARDPRSVAGVITLAGPNMYPPVFADLATRQLFASMRYYYNGFCSNISGECGDIDALGEWYEGNEKERTVPRDADVLFWPLSPRNSRPEAWRRRLQCVASLSVRVLSMGVGAFDKQVFYPSTSIEEEVMHSLGKGSGMVAESCPAEALAAMRASAGGSVAHSTPLRFPIPSLRLDRSTEQLLQVGFSTTHHGINYCSQLFNVYAYGIAEVVNGESLARAFPTFAADVDGGALTASEHDDRMRQISRVLKSKAEELAAKSQEGIESVRIPLPMLAIPRSTRGRLFALVSFNRVVDHASDVWCQIHANKEGNKHDVLAPLKVYRVPFRGGTNDHTLEDHFRPYSETDAHASHQVGRYHSSMVRTVALFDLGNTDLYSDERTGHGREYVTLFIKKHEYFPAREEVKVATRATWLLGAPTKSGDGLAWQYTASHATSATIVGTSPITQLLADGHPVFAAPIDELFANAVRFADENKGKKRERDTKAEVGQAEEVRAVREWALQHHHESDDHTHIIFGGMGAPSSNSDNSLRRGPAPLCTHGGKGDISSTCAVPFAPPISYFDARPKTYIFVALSPLDTDDVSSDKCTLWESADDEKSSRTVCPAARGSSSIERKSPQSSLQGRHLTVLDTETSSWTWFGSRYLIRFAVAAQYYQLMMAVFSGLFLAGFVETFVGMLSALSVSSQAPALPSAATMFPIQMVVSGRLDTLTITLLLAAIIDGGLALWFGFDAETPVPSHHTTNNGVSQDGQLMTHSIGSRDQWWGIPSTAEELVCRFVVQCVGIYVGTLIMSLLRWIGRLMFRMGSVPYDATNAPSNNAANNADGTAHSIIHSNIVGLSLWAVVMLLKCFWFTHFDIPLLILSVGCGVFSVGFLRKARTSAATHCPSKSAPPASNSVVLPTHQPLEASTWLGVVKTRLTKRKGGAVRPEYPTKVVNPPANGLRNNTVVIKQTLKSPSLLLPRLGLLCIVYLVFIMFFFTIRNDVMVAMAAAGQEELFVQRGAEGTSGDRNAFRKPSAPKISPSTFARALAFGSTDNFTPRSDLKPQPSWEQVACAWLLLFAYPFVLLGDAVRLQRDGAAPLWKGISGKFMFGRTASKPSCLMLASRKCILGALIGLCGVGVVFVCQEPLEACPRAVVTIIPTVILIAWASIV